MDRRRVDRILGAPTQVANKRSARRQILLSRTCSYVLSYAPTRSPTTPMGRSAAEPATCVLPHQKNHGLAGFPPYQVVFLPGRTLVSRFPVTYKSRRITSLCPSHLTRIHSVLIVLACFGSRATKLCSREYVYGDPCLPRPEAPAANRYFRGNGSGLRQHCSALYSLRFKI